MAIDLDRRTEALYRAGLADFVALRDQLARDLKVDGRKDEAAAVKALAKPSVSAWAVNQLVGGEPAAFAALMAAGAAVRDAQLASITGRPSDLPGATRARRDALTTLLDRAATVLTAGGHAPTDATLRRVGTTLEAVSTWAEALEGPPPGRLSTDVDPPGFDVLLALAARAPLAPAPAPAPDTAREVALAEDAVADARAALAAAQQTTEHLAGLARERRAEAEELERRLVRLRGEAALAEQEAVAARARQQAAEDQLARARDMLRDAMRRAGST